MLTKLPIIFVAFGIVLTPVWITMVSWLPVHFLISALGRLLALV